MQVYVSCTHCDMVGLIALPRGKHSAQQVFAEFICKQCGGTLQVEEADA